MGAARLHQLTIYLRRWWQQGKPNTEILSVAQNDERWGMANCSRLQS